MAGGHKIIQGLEQALAHVKGENPDVKVHELKSWVGLFQPILQGEKTHDLRVMDRDFKIGDVCRLREYEPVTREYTGREATVQVTYITSSRHQACAFSPFALHPGMACLSIRLITEK